MHVGQKEKMRQKQLFLLQQKKEIGLYNIKSHALRNIFKNSFMHSRIDENMNQSLGRKNSNDVYVNLTLNDFALNNRRGRMQISGFD